MLEASTTEFAESARKNKQLADKGRIDRVFQVGDWIWLKLQAYRQMTV